VIGAVKTVEPRDMLVVVQRIARNSMTIACDGDKAGGMLVTIEINHKTGLGCKPGCVNHATRHQLARHTGDANVDGDVLIKQVRIYAKINVHRDMVRGMVADQQYAASAWLAD
jgi:hypothetical protein